MVAPPAEKKEENRFWFWQGSEFSLTPILLYQAGWARTRVAAWAEPRFRKQFAWVTGHTGPWVAGSGGRGQVFSRELWEEIDHYAGMHACTCGGNCTSVHCTQWPAPVLREGQHSAEVQVPIRRAGGRHRGLHPALRVQRHHNYLLHSSLDDLNQHGPS